MKRTLLIVDDHEMVRAALRDWLAEVFRDIRIIEAGTGEDAVALATSEPIDVVIMDVRLPGISGIEAMRRIKAATPSTEALILTVYDAAEYHTDAMASGARAYVLKNRLHKDLVPELRELLT